MTREKALEVSLTLTNLEELEGFISVFDQFSNDFAPDYGDHIVEKIEVLLTKEKNRLLNKIKSY